MKNWILFAISVVFMLIGSYAIIKVPDGSAYFFSFAGCTLGWILRSIAMTIEGR